MSYMTISGDRELTTSGGIWLEALTIRYFSIIMR